MFCAASGGLIRDELPRVDEVALQFRNVHIKSGSLFLDVFYLKRFFDHRTLSFMVSIVSSALKLSCGSFPCHHERLVLELAF